MNRDYYLANRDHLIKSSRSYYRANREKCREARRQKGIRDRKENIKRYGNRCIRCGIDDWRILCFDHVNDDGAQMRRDKIHPPWGYTFSAWLLKRPVQDWLQLLCHNCNSMKHHHREAYDAQPSA